MPTYTLLEFATVTLEARPNGVGAPKTMLIENRLIYTYFRILTLTSIHANVRLIGRYFKILRARLIFLGTPLCPL
jgi:hypothetical protein